MYAQNTVISGRPTSADLMPTDTRGSPGYELPAGMLHGHAVATGMGFGAYLSFCEDWVTQEELNRILKVLSGLELSLWHPIMEESLMIYRAQEKMIEKRGGNLAAPIPKGIGNCGYLNYMPLELLQQRLEEYKEICQQYPRQGLGVEAHCKEVGLEDPATVGNVNNDLPEEMKHQNSCEKDREDGGKRKKLSYQEWIEKIQKKRNVGFTSNVALKPAPDTPHPPEYEPNELCHPGIF